MEVRGNATAYTGGTTHRPIPHAGDHSQRSTHTPLPPKNKGGIDWDALKPTCKGCGERSGQLGAGALCPICRGAVPEPKVPANLTSVGATAYATLPTDEVEARFTGDKTSPAAFEVFEKPGVGRPRTFDHDEAMRRYALGEPSATIATDLNTKIGTLHTLAKRRGIHHGQNAPTPQAVEEAPSPVLEEVEPTPDAVGAATAPRPAVPTHELDAQINHATRVLRDTTDLENPAARLLRANALSAIEALHIFTQMYPQTPAPVTEIPSKAGAGQTTEHGESVLGGTPEGGAARGRQARPPGTPRRPGERAVRRDKITLDPTAVAEAYKSGKTLLQVAEQFGCSHPVIARILDEQGISRRQAPTNVTPELLEQIRALYVDAQMTQAEVAIRVGVSTKVIQNVMAKHNIEPRPSASDLSKAGVGRPIKIPTEDHPRIVERYLAGESAPVIAETYGASATSIYPILTKAGVTERHGNRCKTGSVGDHAKPLKAQMAELGVTSRQVKEWALTQGLVEDLRVGLPSAHLVDAYAAAHPSQETAS